MNKKNTLINSSAGRLLFMLEKIFRNAVEFSETVEGIYTISIIVIPGNPVGLYYSNIRFSYYRIGNVTYFFYFYFYEIPGLHKAGWLHQCPDTAAGAGTDDIPGLQGKNGGQIFYQVVTVEQQVAGIGRLA